MKNPPDPGKAQSGLLIPCEVSDMLDKVYVPNFHSNLRAKPLFTRRYIRAENSVAGMEFQVSFLLIPLTDCPPRGFMRTLRSDCYRLACRAATFRM